MDIKNGGEKDFSFSRDVKDGEYYGILTVRGSNADKFIANLDRMDALMEKRGMTARPYGTSKYTPYTPVKTMGAAPVTEVAPTAIPANDVKMCPIHKVNMDAKEGRYGKFYSHKAGNEWCNGKIKNERTY